MSDEKLTINEFMSITKKFFVEKQSEVNKLSQRIVEIEHRNRALTKRLERLELKAKWKPEKNKKYSERYDAFYDEVENVWLDGKCDDPLCFYCSNRPEKPFEENSLAKCDLCDKFTSSYRVIDGNKVCSNCERDQLHLR